MLQAGTDNIVSVIENNIRSLAHQTSVAALTTLPIRNNAHLSTLKTISHRIRQSNTFTTFQQPGNTDQPRTQPRGTIPAPGRSCHKVGNHTSREPLGYAPLSSHDYDER